MLWERIIETYQDLPADERVTVTVAARLRKEGYTVPTWQVGKVLKATVLWNLFDDNDLRTTAKVLRTLIDLTRDLEHSDGFSENILKVVNNVTDGLAPKDRAAVAQIRDALAHVIELYLEEKERSYEAEQSRHLSRSRYSPDD